MGKVDERNIYEVKPWLNDDTQNKDVLSSFVGGGGAFIATVNMVDETYLELSATWQEMLNAMSSGKPVLCVEYSAPNVPYSCGTVISVYPDDGVYTVKINRYSLTSVFVTNSETGKPRLEL